MLISSSISLRKETSSLSILEGHALTKAVDVEVTEIDTETAEQAHVVADRVALLQTAHFYLIFELSGILFKPKQLNGNIFHSHSFYCGIPVVCTRFWSYRWKYQTCYVVDADFALTKG